jgi:hypothetical protein
MLDFEVFWSNELYHWVSCSCSFESTTILRNIQETQRIILEELNF